MKFLARENQLGNLFVDVIGLGLGLNLGEVPNK